MFLCSKTMRYCILTFIIIGLPSCSDAPVASKPVRHIKITKSQPAKDSRGQEITKAEDEDKYSEVNGTPQAIEEVKPRQLLVLEYKNAGDKVMRNDVIPIAADSSSFPGLSEALKNLSGNKSTLHNLYIMSQDKDNAKPMKVPVRSEIGIELRLIRFFIDNKQRDAAYITVDNAKKSLALLPPDIQLAEEGKQFSRELEVLESELRKAMPFTL